MKKWHDTNNQYSQQSLVCRYEEAINRNIELESKEDETQRIIADLEAEIRRIKERLADSQAALRKLHDMSSSTDIIKTDDNGKKRARSLSPGR